MGTLASQAEIGVWVQAAGALRRGSGGDINSGNICEIVCAKSCNLDLVHFWPEKNSHNALLNTLNNGNDVSTRYTVLKRLAY